MSIIPHDNFVIFTSLRSGRLLHVSSLVNGSIRPFPTMWFLVGIRYTYQDNMRTCFI